MLLRQTAKRLFTLYVTIATDMNYLLYLAQLEKVSLSNYIFTELYKSEILLEVFPVFGQSPCSISLVLLSHALAVSNSFICYPLSLQVIVTQFWPNLQFANVVLCDSEIFTCSYCRLNLSEGELNASHKYKICIKQLDQIEVKARYFKSCATCKVHGT